MTQWRPNILKIMDDVILKGEMLTTLPLKSCTRMTTFIFSIGLEILVRELTKRNKQISKTEMKNLRGRELKRRLSS